MDLLQRLEGMSPNRLKLLALELDAKVQQLEKARNEPVAIIGLGCRIPGGCKDAGGYWDLLDQGRDAIREVPADRWNIEDYYDPDPDAPGRMSSRWGGFLDNVDSFDAAFFGISRREAVSIDPQQRMLLEVCWEALENAGQSPHKLHGSPTGVYVGIATSDYYNLLLSRGQDAIDAYLATGSAHSVAAGRVAYVLGLQGPNFPVDTACSSSLVAVHLAVQGLRNNECKMALAGGVNVLLSPDISIALSQSHMFARDGRCKAFDAAADGFVRAEGCGIVVLKRLSDALADNDNILAVIRGSAINQDGRSSGISAPNGAAQEAVIRQALANARVQAADIGYVEAHGTGTSLGDPIEAHALASVLGAGRTAAHPLTVGSVKTNVGHLESAAGIAGLIKVVLSLQHGRIPAHLHFHEMNPHIDWKGVPVEIPAHGKDWKPGPTPRLAGVSSFGFSGSNAHIILEEAPAYRQRESTAPERGVHLLTLSGRSEHTLASLAADYAAHLRKSGVSAADLCYTANTGRAHLNERAVYVAANRDELLAKLCEGNGIRGRADSVPDVAFLFTGQGAQFAGMGRQLYETEPVFRQAIDACAAAVKDELHPGLIELLYGSGSELLNDTRYTQPAGFALQYALAQLWNSWGVKPAAVLGHSVGEYAAACVAGMYSLEDGMRFITARGRLTGSLPQGEGAMAAILAPEALVRDAVARLHPWVAIAAHNGPASVVVSGRVREVEQISDQFAVAGFQVERLRVSHAFHSPLMEDVAAQFATEAAAKIAFSEPRAMLFSTVTGGPAHVEQAGTRDYWRRQVRGSVRFHEAIQALAAQGFSTFIEIGPGSTLLGMGQDSIGKDGQLWAPSIRRSKLDNQQMAETLGELYVRGVMVDWDAYEAGRARRRVPLPTYPFERQRYWLDGRVQRSPRRAGARHPMLGARGDAALPVYEGALDLETAPWISDHRVGGAPIVPAAAYLDIATAAAEDALGSRNATVADLQLKEPLRVDPAAGPIRLQTLVVPEGNEAAFRIFSRTDSSASQWTLHATGKLLATPNAASVEDLSSLRQRIRKETSANSFYDALLAKNIDLGVSSRNIRRLWTHDHEALGEIRLDGYDSNGALLDACFQTLGAAAVFGLQAETKGTYVLQSLERFEQSKPLAGTVVAHARILSEEASSMTAELSVFDEAGSCIAAASGIRMTLFAAAAPQAPRDWFYRVEWREQPLAENPASTTGGIAADANRIAALNSQAAHLASVNGLSDYDALRPAMDQACRAYIVAAVEKAGVPFEPGTVLDVSALRVVEKHRRLFERALAILAEDGIVRRVESRWEIVQRPSFNTPDCEELERTFPRFGAELTLLRNCGSHLLEVLRGEADPLELLAPRGSFDTLERLYIHSPAARVFNPAAREALQCALDSAPRDRKIRIVEIGAGTGGTTTYLAPALAGRDCEYVYTDVSPLFTARAQETFRQYPFFQYSVLDVEQPVEAQGFAAGQFDIVVAANVLHATADLRRTVRNAGGLLRTGGLLILIEGTQAERWVDLTFGMTEGWWKFEDAALRPDHALLTREKWLDLLHSEGYRTAMVEPSPRSQQVLLLAQAPDRTAQLESRCVTLSRPNELGSAADCDVVIFDATAGATPWEFITTLKAAAARTMPPRIWLLTANAHAVTATEKTSPQAAAFWGISRTAILEYPQFWGGVIDIEPGIDALSTVLSEIKGGSDEDQIAYRAGRRFVPRIVRQENSGAATPRFQSTGAYVITGGLGNLGLATAEWLVRNGARRLALTGRTASRDQRPEAIAALEKLGAAVTIVAADVSDDAGIASIRAALGVHTLRGIVHTAAVFDATLMKDLEKETFDSVLDPKALGAEKLLGLAGRDLEFFVLFSSTTALIGVRGMSCYAASNAYVDSFAQRARQQGIPAVAINWGTWDLMRGASQQDRENYLRAGLHPMASEQALSALGDVLAANTAQAMIASIDWTALKALYQSRRRRPIFDAVSGTPQNPNAPAKTTTRQSLLTLLCDVPPSDRYSAVVSAVREEAAAVLALKPSEVAAGLGLFEMGMDSLMSVELKRRLEKRCDRSLPSTLTFNYPNVNALATYLLNLVTPDLPVIEDAAAASGELRDEREDLSEDQLADLLKQALNTV